jgi:hypothetical protein
MDGDFVDPASFQLREEAGKFEDGLSINWCEYFDQEPKKAIAPLIAVISKHRAIGKTSKFALLNVGEAKAEALEYVSVSIVTDDDPEDASHGLVQGYEKYNDEVAENLAKVIKALYPVA